MYALYDANNRHPFPIYRRPAGITDTVLLDKPIIPDQLTQNDILYLELRITQKHERLLGLNEQDISFLLKRATVVVCAV